MNGNANTEIHDHIVNRASEVRSYEAGLTAKLGEIHDAHEKALDTLWVASEGNRTIFRRGFRKRQSETYEKLLDTSKTSLVDLFKDQVSFAVQNVETTFGSIWRTRRPHVVGEDVVLKRPLAGDSTLQQGWMKISVNERVRLEGLIRKGISEGKSNDEIALSIRRGNVHKMTRNHSKGLAVTAITSVTAQADLEVYRANENALKGWQYVAVLDSKTSAVCSHRDGRVYSVKDVANLPPAHFRCRSTTTPIFKDWEGMSKLEGVAEVRKRNLSGLTDKQRAFYDGASPSTEDYDTWLRRQKTETQLRHLGGEQRLESFLTGRHKAAGFTTPKGRFIGIKTLRARTYPETSGDTHKFAAAKAELDSLKLGVSRPEDLLGDPDMQRRLKRYYTLQVGDLDGMLSMVNYRGVTMATKKSTKRRVLTSPQPPEKMRFNPVTRQYEDPRRYVPDEVVLSNRLRLVRESSSLKQGDKVFIEKFVNDLSMDMGMNERSAVADNLRVVFTRYREKPEVWGNFKAVLNSQVKFDVMNVSDSIENRLRSGQNPFKRLLGRDYEDPVLGAVQLETLQKELGSNLLKKRTYEKVNIPLKALKLRGALNVSMLQSNPVIWKRLDSKTSEAFTRRVLLKIGSADSADRDSLAVAMGRDLYASAKLNGDRRKWFELGKQVLDTSAVKSLYKLEAFGAQKRRMRSKIGGRYFGPYYDTKSFTMRVTDAGLRDYLELNRKVELGMRIPIIEGGTRLHFKKGETTYQVRIAPGLYLNSGVPITSLKSFKDFPTDLVDGDLTKALNHASSSRFQIDPEYYDAVKRVLNFRDDKGRSKYFDERNQMRKHLAERDDTYERFKTMEWLRERDVPFSNHAFVDHRLRIYDRGLISPQSGETYRPFLNTSHEAVLGEKGFLNFQDQVGAFLGGMSDKLEGRYNSLAVTDRQKIAAKWRTAMIDVGEKLRRGKPQDIRDILDSDFVAEVDGEELTKFFRLSMEYAKINDHLKGSFAARNLKHLENYRTRLALEQDASSSGAQIIALTTKNKKLAEMSNVVGTTQKRRLYDEIAALTYRDPRFVELNKRLGLNEKDLRKAAKAQNMVKNVAMYKTR